MIDEKIVENINSEHWITSILHWSILVLPGFAYVYFSKNHLVHSLDITKIIVISVFYSIPSYLITYFFINHKKLREFTARRNKELDTLEKEVLRSENNRVDYGKFLINKIKEYRKQLDVRSFATVFVVYFSLYASIFLYHSSFNESFFGFNKFFLFYHLNIIFIVLSVRIGFRFSKFLNE